MDTSQSQGLDMGQNCFEDPEFDFDFDALLNCDSGLDSGLDSDSPCDDHDSLNSDSNINHKSIPPELAQSLEACIASAIRPNSESILRVSVSPQHLDLFRSLLVNSPPSRFSYNHIAGIAEVEMSVSEIHHQCQRHLEKLLARAKETLLCRLSEALASGAYASSLPGVGDATATIASESTPTIGNVSIRNAIRRLNNVVEWGDPPIHGQGSSQRQPDTSFCERTTKPMKEWLPSIIGEIAFSQTTSSVERKAMEYIDHVRQGGVRTRLVVIIDIQYPDELAASVSVLAPPSTNSPHPNWLVHRRQFYSRDDTPQPDGQFEIFVSDFLATIDHLPSELRRDHSGMASSDLGRVTISFEHLRDMLGQAKNVLRPVEQ
ncbi:hypothetical protein CPLU01_09232 [Colletotrichum plurivorum]|uniref:Uncharacterized protein n=1 Tax=Colletotrichum plurivorum TaxID=2175906 RepID=A0A8H6K921_9PEZI|nr:hypothetical protein CPLU01_09232 [Colletotrichum plurivorum]